MKCSMKILATISKTGELDNLDGIRQNGVDHKMGRKPWAKALRLISRNALAFGLARLSIGLARLGIDAGKGETITLSYLHSR